MDTLNFRYAFLFFICLPVVVLGVYFYRLLTSSNNEINNADEDKKRKIEEEKQKAIAKRDAFEIEYSKKHGGLK